MGARSLFCVDLNGAAGLKRGVPPEQLAALERFEDSPVFSEREKAALAYAEPVTRSDRRTDEALFERLRRHFDDDAIVGLTALVAHQNLSSKFNAPLGVAPQGFCPACATPQASPARQPTDAPSPGDAAAPSRSARLRDVPA